MLIALSYVSVALGLIGSFLPAFTPFFPRISVSLLHRAKLKQYSLTSVALLLSIYAFITNRSETISVNLVIVVIVAVHAVTRQPELIFPPLASWLRTVC